jgi:hypothetical protein
MYYYKYSTDIYDLLKLNTKKIQAWKFEPPKILLKLQETCSLRQIASKQIQENFLQLMKHDERFQTSGLKIYNQISYK